MYIDSSSNLVMSNFTIEQLNRSQDDLGCSYNVGKYLKSAALEMEVAQILADANVDVTIVNHVCDTIVDHFAVAMYLEQN
tara:strand:+ start:54 stop:293 length:240 start_codon:yes stop_codon:yes gene_type:complete